MSTLCNTAVDCDCCAVVQAPCMADIGILSSMDPAALDQACSDRLYQSADPGKKQFLRRAEPRHGAHTMEDATTLCFGDRVLELISTET